MAASSNRRSVMTLYSDPRHPDSHRVRMVLAEKGISVEIVDADSSEPGEELLELNPYGNLPTLVDRDLVLYESRIIMEYLDERFPHPPLLPVDPVMRANSRLFLHRVDEDWFRPMMTILRDGDPDGSDRKVLKESLVRSAPIFAAHPYFMSDELTLVDCSISPLLWRLPMMGMKLPAQCKPLLEYAARMFKRKSFQDSLTELEKEMRD
jgi:RNA polymerase-associated protein